MQRSTSPYEFPFRPDIQGLRGLAVILVILFHVGFPLHGGFIGVDVFFVLSGYVITGQILKNLHNESFSFREFYARRIRRLLPVLSFILSVVLLGSILFAPVASLDDIAPTAIATVFLHANLYLQKNSGYFAPEAEYNPLLHTWSLSVEEQFYLLFPLLIVLLWRTSSRFRLGRIIKVLLALSVLSFGVSVLFTHFPHLVSFANTRMGFYSPLSRSWEFAAGALLALSLPWLKNTKRNLDVIGWLGLFAILLSAIFINGKTTLFPGYIALAPVLATMALLLPGMTKHGHSLFLRLLSAYPLRRVGDLSYSLYLWHWALIVFAMATFPQHPLLVSSLASIVSLGLALATEKWIENPLRYQRLLPNLSVWKLGAACVAIPLVCAFIHTNAISYLKKNHNELKSLNWMTFLYFNGDCDTTRNHFGDLHESCTWNPEGTWNSLLVGDSNARQWIPALREITSNHQGQFSASTFSGCPFTDLELYRDGYPRPLCRQWVEQNLVAIEVNPPDVVFLSSAYDIYSVEKRWKIVDPDTAEVVSSSLEKEELLKEGTRRVFDRILQAGSRVVVIDSLPKFLSAPDPSFYQAHRDKSIRAAGRRCSLLALSLWIDDCNLIRPNQNTPDWMDTDIGSRVISSTSHKELHLIGLSDVFCENNICMIRRNEEWLFYDYGHLSYAGMREILPHLGAQLAPLLTPYTNPTP